MDIRKVIKRSVAAGIVLFMVVAVQFFVSCGRSDSNYEKPLTTQTDSALISAATLSAWMDAGKVNATGYDRVVILDVTSYGTYTANHIPGALFVDSGEIAQNRNEGVGSSGYEVLEGAKMDDLIQRCGIDGNTTIVFTSTSLTHPTRAYFTFRYWGFPKNRLKLLDGLNTAWAAYGLTPGLPPVVTRSNYSVRDNGLLRDDLRVSLAEMIDYADGKFPNAVAIDVRGTESSGSYAGVRGSTPGIFNPGSDYTVFEGRIKGAKALAGSTLYSSPSYTFKTVDELITAFTSTSIGLDRTKTAYLYCVKAAASSVTFFILDGILGWPAAVYDGSWTQWGQLSGYSSMKGQLDPNSRWRTDIPSRSENVVYNYPVISTPAFTGTGANNLTTGSLYSGTTTSTFTVQITSAGTGTTPDTFKWSSDNGTTWSGTIAITPSNQTLINSLTIKFGTTTGHAVDDSWTFTATAGKTVEQFTVDGSICSATYKLDGTMTTSSGGTGACTNTPNSWDADANRIEEADKAYMGAGGSGGTSGGGTSVPAGC